MSDSIYHLPRDYKESLRLNVQHYYTLEMQGYVIHPTIKLGPDAVIGDLAAGTGVWALQLARQLPKTVQFDVIDVDLTQLPIKEWLPENVRPVQWSFYDPIPSSMHEKYDLLHVRYIMLAITNQDPTPVIENLVKVTKKGGWIQWAEIDVYGTQMHKASNDLASTNVEKMLDWTRRTMVPRCGDPPGWPSKTAEFFKQQGLTDIQHERHDTPAELRPAMFDNILVALEEVAEFSPNPDEVYAMLEGAAEEMKASNRGLAITYQLVTTIGRKPA